MIKSSLKKFVLATSTLSTIMTVSTIVAIAAIPATVKAAAITISSKQIEKTQLKALVDRYNNYHPSVQAQDYNKYRGVYINGTDAVKIDMSSLTALNPALNTSSNKVFTDIKDQHEVQEAKKAMTFLNTEEGKTFGQLLDDTRNTIITAIHPAAVGTSMSKKLGIQNNKGKIPNDFLGGNISPTRADTVIPSILFNDNIQYAKIVGAKLGYDSQWAEYFSQILDFAKRNENISQANKYFINHEQLGNEYNANYVQSGRNSKKADAGVAILNLGSGDEVAIDTYKYILAKALKDGHLTEDEFLKGAINPTAADGSGRDRRLAVQRAVEHYGIKSTDITYIDNGFYHSSPQRQNEMDQSVLQISHDDSNALLQGLKQKIAKSFKTHITANAKSHINMTTLFNGFSDKEMEEVIGIASLVSEIHAKVFISAFNDTYGPNFLNMIKEGVDNTAPYKFEHDFIASSTIPGQSLSDSAAQHAFESKKIMDANVEVKNEAVKLLSEAGYGTAYSITTTLSNAEQIMRNKPSPLALIKDSKEDVEIIKEYNNIMSGFNKVLPQAMDNWLLVTKNTAIQKKLELVKHGKAILEQAVKFAYKDDDDAKDIMRYLAENDDDINMKDKKGINDYVEMLNNVTSRLQEAQSTIDIDIARATVIQNKAVLMKLRIPQRKKLINKLADETEEYGDAECITEKINIMDKDIDTKDKDDITQYNNILSGLLKYKAIDESNIRLKQPLSDVISEMYTEYDMLADDAAIKACNSNEDALEIMISAMIDHDNFLAGIQDATPNEVRRVAKQNLNYIEEYCTTVDEANRTKKILAVLLENFAKYTAISIDVAQKAAITARESRINIDNTHIDADVLKGEALRLSNVYGNLFSEEQYNAALAATENTIIEGLDLENAKAWKAVYEMLPHALNGAKNLNAKQAAALQYKAKIQAARDNEINTAIAILVQNGWPLDNLGSNEGDRTNTVKQILGHNDEWITDKARTHEEINQYNRVMRIMLAEVIGLKEEAPVPVFIQQPEAPVQEQAQQIAESSSFDEIFSSDYSQEEISSYVQEHKTEVAQEIAEEYNVNQARVQQMLEDNIISSKADTLAIISTIAQEEKVEQTQHMNHSQQHSEVMSVAMDNVTSRITGLIAPSMSNSGSAGSTMVPATPRESGSAGSTMAPATPRDSGGSPASTTKPTSNDGGTGGSTAAPTATGGENGIGSNDNNGSTAAPTATGGENVNGSNDNNGSNEDTLLEASGAGIAAGDAYERFGVWAQVIGSVGKQKARKGASGFASSMIGGMIGADTLVSDRTLIGLTFGNVNNNVKFKNTQTGDKSKSSSWVFSAYAHQQLDNNWFMRGNVAYTKTAVDNKDQRLIGPGRKGIAHSKYNIHSFGVEMTVGKSLRMQNGVVVVPSVGLRAAHTNKISYQETGSTTTNQKITQNASNNVQGVAGLQVMKMFEQNGTIITPDIHANVQYGLGVKSPKGTYTSQFDSSAVSYTGLKPSRISSTVGVGLTMESGSVEGGISYDANIAAGYLGHQGTLKLKVKF